jgi:hypothetical protein
MSRPFKKHAPHVGAAVAVGPYTVLAGGLQYLKTLPEWPGNIIVPLTNEPLPPQAESCAVVPLYLPDFGGVPSDWMFRLADITDALAAGATVMAFCMAGHGRTGTFLASLIALLEDDHRTPDPIKAVRERHCEHAVESVAQGEAIFHIRGRTLPRKYRSTLWAPRPIHIAARS